ncbi:MarR family transcriptional regulator [Altericroceibacterium spongiae]|uniref:MarR family transcriptional regulator n=1 Tax=Altericroceibacterium spongiae TaxID=2320269 RepID=A0A420EKW6_9SPHN|nr:MarR family transcriptional regulator [Altericroceibacterium spongiae]RKF21246.1 MarR family transcriptional regulator [Altericroceibacterium spongiae]
MQTALLASEQDTFNSDTELMQQFLYKPGFLAARIDQICTVLFAELTPDVTLPQAELMLLIDRRGAMSQIDLARAAGNDKSTTAYIVSNLEKAGRMIRYSDAKDRRVLLADLSDRARDEMTAIREHFARLQVWLAQGDSAEAHQALISILQNIARDGETAAPPWQRDPSEGAPDLDDATSFLVRRLLQALQAECIARTAGLNVTLRQFSLLFILRHRRSITQGAFSRLFGLDPSTCSVIMRGLEKRGMIGWKRSQTDKRERIYQITELGQQTFPEYYEQVRIAQRWIMRQNSQDDFALMVDQMRRIVRVHNAVLRYPGMVAELIG